jgi:hypothetical protein
MERPSDEETEEQVGKVVREMRAHFLVPPDMENLWVEFDRATAPLAPSHQTVARAFRHSAASTVSTVSMPFALAHTSAYERRFQMFLAAARMRARYLDERPLPPNEDPEAVWEERALAKAEVKMREFCESHDGSRALHHDISLFLLSSLKMGFQQAAQELLQQGLALLWSAFEVLCRDAFESLLNEDPSKIRTLISHPDTRKRFEAERLPIGTLAQHGFDLSARLGTVLVDQQDFSSLPTIKAVYAVLYPCTSLIQALAHRDLWTLYQRRHLIVHRRGVVDQAYIDATGAAHAVGNHLVVSPEDFEAALGVVISSGTELTRCLPTSNPI